MLRSYGKSKQSHFPLGFRWYTPQVVPRFRKQLEDCAPHLVGVGRLASMMPKAYFPLPKTFGFYVVKGARDLACFKHIEFSIQDVASAWTIYDDTCLGHCEFAVLNEFPWFPLLDGLHSSPTVRHGLAKVITTLANETDMARRWWFAYEMFLGKLPLEDVSESSSPSPINFLPPDRFFCTSGQLSQRHAVIDNLLGTREFCPFVAKFPGTDEAAENFQAGLSEALAPICLLTIKDIFEAANLDPRGYLSENDFEQLIRWFCEDGFAMNEREKIILRRVLGVGQDSQHAPVSDLALFLRGQEPLAVRLRKHLLASVPDDPSWRMPGESFLERLSHVVAAVETRTSQMIEGALPPERADRFYVDVLSEPQATGRQIDDKLIANLQRGVLSRVDFADLEEQQWVGQGRRNVQNFVATSKNDGHSSIVSLELLPPPPDELLRLMSGYFTCMQRLMKDPSVDPIVCASIAKITFNTLHPMADGNGRVQRALFQFVLIEKHFLPNVNVPISVIIVQDRKAYEKLQGLHCNQIMAGVAHMEMNPGVEDYEHIDPHSGIVALYRFQDVSFAHRAMVNLMEASLPVLAAKAYFLQRFDERTDFLLKADPMLPLKAATMISKAFRNDKHGPSLLRILKLLLTDGWWIGFGRIMRLLLALRQPSDNSLTLGSQMAATLRHFLQRRVGQFARMITSRESSNTSSRMTIVGISRSNFDGSALALKKALRRARAGDTVTAVYFPMNPYARVEGLSCTPVEIARVQGLITQVFMRVQEIVDAHIHPGVLFKSFAGEPTARPLQALVDYLSNVRPDYLYIGYNTSEPLEHDEIDTNTLASENSVAENFKFTFAAKIVEYAPCNIVIVRRDNSPQKRTIWVGISARNFNGSMSALQAALTRSAEGDTVVATRFPADISGAYGSEDHMSSALKDDWLEFMDTVQNEMAAKIQSFASNYQKHGVDFRLLLEEPSSKPRDAFCRAARSVNPDTIYIGYARMESDPRQSYRFAGHIIANTSCDLVIIKRDN